MTYGGAMYSIGAGGLPITPFAAFPACGSLTSGPGGWFAGTYNHDTIDQMALFGGPIRIFAGQDLASEHVDGPISSSRFNVINGIVWLDANALRDGLVGRECHRLTYWCGQLRPLYRVQPRQARL